MFANIIIRDLRFKELIELLLNLKYKGNENNSDIKIVCYVFFNKIIISIVNF